MDNWQEAVGDDPAGGDAQNGGCGGRVVVWVLVKLYRDVI